MKPDKPTDAAKLRRQAEERLKNRRSEAGDQRSTQDTQRLLHELQVHQIELEMRNEELQETRREVEAALAQYIDLYDFAPVGYFTLDCDGAIRRVNLTGTGLLGVERSRLLNRRFGLFVSEDSRPVFNAFLEKVFEGQAKEACEITLMREGNQPFWAYLEARASEDGQECRSVVADITERRQAESTLRAIFDSTGDGILLAEAETRRFVHANNAISRMLGYSQEEIMDLSVADIHPAEDLPHVSAQFEKQLRGEITLAPGLPVKRKDGSVFYADVSTAPLKLEGRPHMLGIFRDITERKRAEESLRQSEENYRSIFEGAAEGILIAEHHTRDIKYVNPAMCRMLGYNEDELKHLIVNDIHPAYILDRLGSDFEAHDRERKTMLQQDIECKMKDGTIIYADVVITTRIIIDGIPHSAAFFTDVTEKKKAEDDKKKLEVQLLQARKLEAVGRLTGGIAHDFNNILTAIIGNAEIILADLPKGDPMREGVEEIRVAGDRAVSLTGQLLAFSRKQVLQPTVMSLNETVRDMDRMLRRIIGEDIELRTILAPDLGLVEADAGQIEQVIMNLAVNARDAMPVGGKLTIETANAELDEGYSRAHIAVIPGSYVMLSVSDTGVGMTKEVQGQIFEPFFTTKEIGKGTGLGLSTVYGIVKQSKGNIWVYSEPGKGTTFKIYLPRVERSIYTKKKRDKKAGPVTGSETILIVEDDEMVRNFTARVLKGCGYRVLVAADGEEAVRVSGTHEGPIHLMLTDVVMPGMSGQELGERLGASRPGIKALYMSGYADNAIVHHGVLDPEKAFLPKPFTPDALGRKVREVLGD
jgi:two-component system cell cycle sensor histidine kinase/response regulator CckA